MEIDLPLVCRIPYRHFRSQAHLIEDGWKAVETFYVMGKRLGTQLFELSPQVRRYREDDRAGVLKVIHDVKWTSRLFKDEKVPYSLALQHKCRTFERAVEQNQPVFVYQDGDEILGFVQMESGAVELIAAVRRGLGHKLLNHACWHSLSENLAYITAGTSDEPDKMTFYQRNGFAPWESYVTFHKWKDGVKPSLPSCRPVSVLKGSRRKPSAKSPGSH